MATAAKIDGQTLRPVEDTTKRRQIVDAIGSYNISKDRSWSEFNDLSSRTEFDSLEAVPEGIFELGNDEFQASATVFVTLNYDGETDGISASETFPAHVKGHFDDKRPVIDSVEVDTSSLEE